MRWAPRLIRIIFRLGNSCVSWCLPRSDKTTQVPPIILVRSLIAISPM